MIKRRFQDIELSGLGFGCMRLPVIDGDDTRIDEAKVKEMVAYAMAHGVNYYDTAWGYHGGNSELALGNALQAYPRQQFYVATKFPGYDLANFGKTKEIFEQQLAKLQVSAVDFYLFHNVCEMNINRYLDDAKYGTYSELMKQKKAGRIRHLGFSCHGRIDVLKRFLEAYGKDMEFCQIQLNYLDWNFQDAKDKVALLKSWGIPVWVMEPLRGGRLARLSAEDTAVLKQLRPQEETPAWAFRFLQSLPEVGMILSGMSTLDQMKANIRTFETDQPLNAEEFQTITEIADRMVKKIAVPCTACHYCTSHCPQGLPIPDIMALYNEHAFTGGGFIAPMALMAIPPEKHPDACRHCHSCEKVCPQGIKISDVMTDFVRRMQR